MIVNSDEAIVQAGEGIVDSEGKGFLMVEWSPIVLVLVRLVWAGLRGGVAEILPKLADGVNHLAGQSVLQYLQGKTELDETVIR